MDHEVSTKVTSSMWTGHEPVHIVCSSCGDKGYWPISREWWNKHTSYRHTLKHWFKRLVKDGRIKG